MTRLQRLSLATLIVGLVLAALIVPWSLSTIRKTTDLLRQQQELLTPVPAPTPNSQQIAQARAASEARAVAQKAADEQSVRLTAALAKVAAAVPKPAPTPEPIRAAYSIVPQGSAQLIPLEGWVDQPNKDRPGRVHTNLMVRHVNPGIAVRTPARQPCLKMVSKPAERIERPYGWIDVPARTILVPCQQ